MSSPAVGAAPVGFCCVPGLVPWVSGAEPQVVWSISENEWSCNESGELLCYHCVLVQRFPLLA